MLQFPLLPSPSSTKLKLLNQLQMQSPQPSEIKQLLHLRIRICWVLNGMPNRPRVLINLVVITPLHRLVAEEMDSVVFYTIRQVGVVFDMTEAVGFVPAGGENVEGDLATDRVSVFSLV
jgi:hypothetical protein